MLSYSKYFGEKIFMFTDTLSCEYRVAGNWYSQLVFISEDQFSINLHKQEQLMNIWLHNDSTSHLHNVTEQLCWRHTAKSEKTAIGVDDEMSEISHKIMWKK